ncbi:MAG: UDP-3-O-(3-hydroxymyristoyl)glucosamine N-acyltransferase [Candidatus Melainabacteria bacterium]|nr:UDP-3-O-(3-hydroxymyristoyl)glucosamine N-acyltransferase [Candidatus Melainabacteria bacterium]
MQVKELAQIASAKVQGSEELEINSIAADPAKAQADQLAMIFPVRFAKAQRMLKGSQAKLLLVSDDLASDDEFQKFVAENSLSLLIVARPKFALKALIIHFEKPRSQVAVGVHPTAVIADGAQVDPAARIGALAYVGAGSQIGAGTELQARAVVLDNVVIGQDCVIKPGAVIEDYSVLGDRVVVHPNAVIGADGYSYSTEEQSNLEKMQRKDFSFNMDRQVQHKINSAGNVTIGDDVEIGAGTCIDRATIGATEIGTGTKIDNNCQIAHNVKIGKDVLVIAQSGLAGSAKIGDRVVIAGHCGIGDGVEIGNDAVVGAFSGVNSDIDQFMPVLGIPAIAYGEFMRRQKALGRICKSQEELRRLKTKVEDLAKN